MEASCETKTTSCVFLRRPSATSRRVKKKPSAQHFTPLWKKSVEADKHDFLTTTGALMRRFFFFVVTSIFPDGKISRPRLMVFAFRFAKTKTSFRLPPKHKTSRRGGFCVFGGHYTKKFGLISSRIPMTNESAPPPLAPLACPAKKCSPLF